VQVIQSKVVINLSNRSEGINAMSNLQSGTETRGVEELSTLTGEIVDDRTAPVVKLNGETAGALDLAAIPEKAEDESIDELIPAQQFPPKWLTIGAAALVAIGGGWFWLNRPTEHPVVETSTNPPIQVSTQVATSQAIAGTQTLTGTVEPVEVVTTTSRVMGQIISLPVKEGDRVKAGQILAKIDVKDINAQRNQATAAITQAQAGVTVAQAAQRQQAQAQHRNAIAQKQSVQVELINAQLTQKRRVMLQREGAIGQSSLDEANTQVAVLQSRVQQATASIDQASQGVSQATAGIAQAQAGINQAKAGISRSRAALAQAQSQIKQAAAGVNQARAQVQQAEASKSQVTANLDYGIVTAPFNGVVTRKHTEVGAMAGAGQPIVTLENTSKQRFSVDVPESSISQFKQGDRVTIRLDSIQQVINGTVDRVIPAANSNSHSFNIKIALPSNTALMSGMFGRLELPGTLRQGITIPSSALMRRGQLEGVYVMGSNNQATLRWVKIGKVQNRTVEITSGLSLGDRIITTNLTQLSDGQAVTVAK
jgi:HlyD family secretion protein